MAHEERLCATFHAAMDVLARPWSGIIIAVLEGGALRFSEIAERSEGIGDRMLAARLKELEVRGLVVRRVIPGPPVRVEYELTDVGRGFRHVSDAVSQWGKAILRASASKAEAKVVSFREKAPRARAARVK